MKRVLTPERERLIRENMHEQGHLLVIEVMAELDRVRSKMDEYELSRQHWIKERDALQSQLTHIKAERDLYLMELKSIRDEQIHNGHGEVTKYNNPLVATLKMYASEAIDKGAKISNSAKENNHG